MGAARLRVAVAVAASLLVLVFGAGPASAATPVPGWTIDSFATPTNFSANDNTGCGETVNNRTPKCDAYLVTVTNAGSVPTDGSNVTLTDALPEGLTVQRISLFSSLYQKGEFDLGGFLCSRAPVKCEYPGPFSFPGAFVPDGTLKMIVYVTVEPNAPAVLASRATVSGGGAPDVSVEDRNAVSSTPAPFGASGFDFSIDGLDGTHDTQAGDHPYGLTTTIDLNNTFRQVAPTGFNQPNSISVEDPRDIIVNLPLGFVGSTLAAPQCTLAELSSASRCPADTVVGHMRVEPQLIIDSPIYNLVPERGYPAELGYFDSIKGSHVFYVRVVPTRAGYVLQTVAPDITEIGLGRIVVTLYGDPRERQAEIHQQELEQELGQPVQRERVTAPVPFFTSPTDCSGEEPTATVYMDSWQNPAKFNPDGTPVDLEESAWATMQSKSPPVTGCNALQFPAEVKSQPTTHESDKPSGMDFEIKLPQSETVGVPATSALKKVVVTLPEGFTVDPSAGDGLQACSEAQIGWLGGTHRNFNPQPPACPEASKIGTLELESPLVSRKIEGVMYLASQNENPFGSTLAAYVVVDDPITGVLIKIVGELLPDPHTGRLTAVFDENPDLPFSDLQLHFFGGPRAELATPESCGTFTTSTELVPYSAPDSGPPATPFNDFVIDEACPGGFSPSFTAGSLNLQSGAYTPFVVSFSRSDTDQELQGLTVTLPPGLLANLTGVPLCSDADATAAACPAGSQVGTVLTSVGPGPNPLQVAGKAYLTGPYNGGPYGLAVVVPAVAGPFNFGTVVVRQSIRIDPLTAQVTDVSDPFPTIIDGIPLRLRRVDVSLGRPGGFTFNPTNCSKLGFSGTISGTPLGAPTTLSGTIGYAILPGETSSFTSSTVPFQVTNCGSLGFKPVFNVSTQGKTSRVKGASLTVKLTYPKASLGSQTNIRSVKVDLPKQLPSRLTTLQKACPDATFTQNPAACPPGSRVGTATASSPILEAVLSGPAYFVSHGGAKFPELVIVLAGQGITVQLHGETFISKAGITSSTFRTIPDVPIGVFTLNLPESANSALAANGDLCAQQLYLPTSFTAQNGATLTQRTKISVAGCKPELKVLRHSVRGSLATIVARAPSAGRLVASGQGFSSLSRRLGKAGKATFELSLSKVEQRFVAQHHGRRLKVNVKLVFTPTHGEKLSRSVTVLLG